MNFDERVSAIADLIQEWFNLNGKIEARPKDIMDYLVEKGVYNHDNRSGNPLRKDLRKLKKLDMLNLIYGLECEERGNRTYWYFKIVQ